MSINTHGYRRCTKALSTAYEHLQRTSPDDVMYEVFRAACAKEFELVLERGGNLFRKALHTWILSHAQVDKLSFKNVYRHAAKHGLITTEASERWIEYRDYRNNPAYEYSENFADAVVAFLPQFIDDAQQLARAIESIPTKRIHLLPRHREQLNRLLKCYLPDVEVWAYGSRVNGRSHDASDLDLVLRAAKLQEIPLAVLSSFRRALQESNIPFLVEFKDWGRIPEDYHREIERNYVVLRKPESGQTLSSTTN